MFNTFSIRSIQLTFTNPSSIPNLSPIHQISYNYYMFSLPMFLYAKFSLIGFGDLNPPELIRGWFSCVSYIKGIFKLWLSKSLLGISLRGKVAEFKSLPYDWDLNIVDLVGRMEIVGQVFDALPQKRLLSYVEDVNPMFGMTCARNHGVPYLKVVVEDVSCLSVSDEGPVNGNLLPSLCDLEGMFWSLVFNLGGYEISARMNGLGMLSDGSGCSYVCPGYYLNSFVMEGFTAVEGIWVFKELNQCLIVKLQGMLTILRVVQIEIAIMGVFACSIVGIGMRINSQNVAMRFLSSDIAYLKLGANLVVLHLAGFSGHGSIILSAAAVLNPAMLLGEILMDIRRIKKMIICQIALIIRMRSSQSITSAYDKELDWNLFVLNTSKAKYRGVVYKAVMLTIMETVSVLSSEAYLVCMNLFVQIPMSFDWGSVWVSLVEVIVDCGLVFRFTKRCSVESGLMEVGIGYADQFGVHSRWFMPALGVKLKNRFTRDRRGIGLEHRFVCCTTDGYCGLYIFAMYGPSISHRFNSWRTSNCVDFTGLSLFLGTKGIWFTWFLCKFRIDVCLEESLHEQGGSIYVNGRCDAMASEGIYGDDEETEWKSGGLNWLAIAWYRDLTCLVVFRWISLFVLNARRIGCGVFSGCKRYCDWDGNREVGTCFMNMA